VSSCRSVHMPMNLCADWNERMEDPEDGRIWETSWDSEDVSDRFSAELKHRLAVQN
jgi:hypothetical protein